MCGLEVILLMVSEVNVSIIFALKSDFTPVDKEAARAIWRVPANSPREGTTDPT
jgi:hypothetical protein